MSDWNTNIINEFRSNDGKVGGVFDGWTLLLLHTTGAKSGQPRLNPLAYQAVDGGYAVFASKGGAPTHPDWYHNVVANPEVEIEVGAERLQAKARVAPDEERAPIWEKQKAAHPQFAKYEAGTDRRIPVVILEPL
ncbi:MAG: nitroreductase family deazaflavin-dependent oxidoreductase [Acidimicrobiia bacterium]|nr:nitroreductase family deazaflavin-dependent oxidoreductase [Acidimicrobiia bacterium]